MEPKSQASTKLQGRLGTRVFRHLCQGAVATRVRTSLTWRMQRAGQPESRAELRSTSKDPAGPVGGMQRGFWHHFFISSPLMMKEQQAIKATRIPFLVVSASQLTQLCKSSVRAGNPRLSGHEPLSLSTTQGQQVNLDVLRPLITPLKGRVCLPYPL